MRHLLPMLATSGETLPLGDEWVHEVKWDGMRVLFGHDEKGEWIHTRSGKDVTRAFPEVAQAVRRVAPGMVLDAELVSLADGRPSFAALSRRLHRDRPTSQALATVPVTAMVFDLLADDSTDLTMRPWSQRRARLEQVLGEDGSPSVSLSPAYDDGQLLRGVTREQALEGTIAKRRTSLYRPGVRSRDWLKFPHRSQARFAVGGWTAQEGSNVRLGSLLVGEADPTGVLVYRGRVGSGVTERVGRQLRERMRSHEVADSPFAQTLSAQERSGVHWVEPVIEVQVEHLGLTDAGRLRQASLRVVHDG